MLCSTMELVTGGLNGEEVDITIDNFMVLAVFLMYGTSLPSFERSILFIQLPFIVQYTYVCDLAYAAAIPSR
ncbi:hypothetical protein L195_g049411 [Trifolium pratense]|uniref:Uncharacterized protein n=1 Tax=Trifolium pratense TaxID=57577 RepID=A0A2K3JP09_TRIPR|nr:hypothetical protein L195_g049411 [Trifolium pratense]